ncbi:MAG: hypothetical protein AMXMBFR4_31730 [Candidatus Hydrogenedentota bacterium]
MFVSTRGKGRPAWSRDSAGTTHLELIAAVFVVSVGIFGAFQLFRFCLDRTAAINEINVAVRAVQNELETLRAAPFDQLVPGERGFISSTPELDRLAHVAARVVISAEPEHPDSLRRVSATVTWIGENARRIEKSMTTLIGERRP